MAALVERGAVRRPGRGRPRLRPDRVAGDKSYTGRPTRASLHRCRIVAVIPRLRTEPQRGVRFGRAAYRERNVVARTINRLKRYRAASNLDDQL